MVCILSQKELRRVQSLPFCYICGRFFLEKEFTHRDHVPPKSAFLAKDREPLLLPSHKACNEGWSAIDERMGQLIGIHTGKFPVDTRKRRLRLIRLGSPNWGGITGVNLERAVWRWIAGFHAALYEQPLVNFHPFIVLPFTRLDLSNGRYAPAPTGDMQHKLCVDILKQNRVRGTLDVILANKGTLRYECV